MQSAASRFLMGRQSIIPENLKLSRVGIPILRSLYVIVGERGHRVYHIILFPESWSQDPDLCNHMPFSSASLQSSY